MGRKMLLACLALAFILQAGQARAASRATVWVGTWAASQQAPEPRNALAPDDLRNATLRQIVHLPIGGRVLRVHLSIASGTIPLPLESLHIARALSAASARINLSKNRRRTPSQHDLFMDFPLTNPFQQVYWLVTCSTST